jgi:hypothetical protein
VGDEVDLRITLKTEPGFRIRSPEELPMVSWIELSSVKVERADDAWRVTVRFSPFAPGTRTLPQIRLGDVVLSDIKIHTSSILEERQAEFYGIKGQLLLPGTRIALGILVVVLFFGPIFVFGFGGRIKRAMGRVLSTRRGRKPYKRLLKAVKELREQQAHMSSKRFYIVLSDELRRFLTDRTGDDYISITTSELQKQLTGELPDKEKGRLERIAEMQRKSDQIKFGGANASKKERENDIETVLDVAGEIEKMHDEAQRRRTSRGGNTPHGSEPSPGEGSRSRPADGAESSPAGPAAAERGSEQ